MNRETAERIVGGTLSQPSKMPGYGFGLPAIKCKTGSWLRRIPESACSKCYALKGRYMFRNVVDAQMRRFKKLKAKGWVEAMTWLIKRTNNKWFRWHDSGDIQDIEHLENIVKVALRLPNVRFWLPTREKSIVRAYVAQYGDFPNNLVVRVSAAMIGGEPPMGFKHTSTIEREGATCPARQQGNVCGSCRKCWDRRVRNVSYELH